MQSAEDHVRLDIPDPLNGTKCRRIFVQRPVRSDVIVIEGIGSQDPAQMPVCTENRNPHVMVMKSAEDWIRFDISSPLNRARDRRILVQ